jgi:ketosteroid isomerase-like protein
MACLAAGRGTPAVCQDARTDSTAVVAAVSDFHEALARGDSAAALAFLAVDAMVLEAGGIETLNEYRAHHLAGDIRFARAVTSFREPVRVTIAGDAAWVTSRSETSGAFQDRQVSSVGAELMVLTRSHGRWQIRAIHWSSRRRGPG